MALPQLRRYELYEKYLKDLSNDILNYLKELISNYTKIVTEDQVDSLHNSIRKAFDKSLEKINSGDKEFCAGQRIDKSIFNSIFNHNMSTFAIHFDLLSNKVEAAIKKNNLFVSDLEYRAQKDKYSALKFDILKEIIKYILLLAIGFLIGYFTS